MIHVIGNAAVDTLIRLERLPRPGETVIARGAVEDLGGKGANQAVVVARCGMPVRLVAAIGDDAPGERIRKSLAAEGVAIDGLAIWAGPTDRCVIYVDRAGENTIVSQIEAAQRFDPLPAIAAGGWIAPEDYVLLQGNLRPDVLRRCLDVARQRAAVTVLNPSPISDPADYDWALVDVAVLNRGEAQALGAGPDPAEAAGRLRQAGAGTVVVTLGPEGALLAGGEGRLSVKAPAVAAADATGAGDVFCGALVAARMRGLSWSQSLGVAIDAAAIKVARPGVRAGFPTRDELARIMTAAAEPARLQEDSKR
jgi:ribokinase